jgi:exodeoxyribonuclease III
MKIVSWNVNGIRAGERKGFLPWLYDVEPDILGIQETKAEEEQLSSELRAPHGYHAYFASSRLKKGYSGVALYTRVKPDKVEYGMGISRFDDEGRVIIGHFGNLVVLNVYFPNGGGGPERLSYKLDFYDTFLSYIETLRRDGKDVLFMGDVNTAHEPIDLARPKENETHTGFLPEEREWIDAVVNHGYVDTFRRFHPETVGAYSYWDTKTSARERNVGWRIDYIFVSPSLLPRVKRAGISSEVLGSDHCPVWIELGAEK